MIHSRSTGLRSRIRHHREEVVARHELERELADFATPAERLELETILARHHEEDRRLVENLLAVQDDRRLHQA
jgi:hypothetical protein